jgi:hypothetical protein
MSSVIREPRPNPPWHLTRRREMFPATHCAWCRLVAEPVGQVSLFVNWAQLMMSVCVASPNNLLQQAAALLSVFGAREADE